MKTEREFIEGIYRKAEVQRQQEAPNTLVQTENAARGREVFGRDASEQATFGQKLSGWRRYGRTAGTVVLAAACLLFVYMGGRSLIAEKPGTAVGRMAADRRFQPEEAQSGDTQSGDALTENMLTENTAQEASNGESDGTMAAAPYGVAAADAGVGLRSRIIPEPQEYKLAVEVAGVTESADGVTKDTAGGRVPDAGELLNGAEAAVVIRYLVLESVDGLAEAGEEVEISLSAADYEYFYPDGAVTGERQLLTVHEGENGLVLSCLDKMEETSENSEVGK